jgi:hypothetical protein
MGFLVKIMDYFTDWNSGFIKHSEYQTYKLKNQFSANGNF